MIITLFLIIIWRANPVAAAGDPGNTYVIFLSGLQSACDGTRFNNMGFEGIRRGLKESGYKFLDDRFILFSYRGGRMIKDAWLPEKYGPMDTGQPIMVSVLHLKQMIEEHSSVHPEARYILAGHSLGGRIALDFAATTDREIRRRISGVVTFNSPILGSGYHLPDSVLRMLGQAGIIWGSPAVRQLVWERKNCPDLSLLRAESARELYREGVLVTSFSSSSDILVSRSTSCIPMNGGGSPVNILIRNSRFSLDDISGHMRILDHSAVKSYMSSLVANILTMNLTGVGGQEPATEGFMPAAFLC